MVSGIENTVDLLHMHKTLSSGESPSPVCLDCCAMQSIVSVEHSIVLQENRK